MIRKIARSMEYQRMYALMLDSHIPMFDGALTVMSEMQRDLMYWCKFYYSFVFSQKKIDQPTEFVIDYDILMDEWIDKKEFQETSNTATRKRSSAGEMDHVIEF